MPKRISPADGTPSCRIAVVTLDAHLAGPVDRARERLAVDMPGLEISVHAAAEWGENPPALEEAKQAVAGADIVIATMLFLEDHINAIRPTLEARREHCDAMVCCVAAPEITSLTRMGRLDMAKPATGMMALMKRLRGSKKPGKASGANQMAMLRRLPRLLRFVPGKAQDLRGYFLTMLYWLGGSDRNVEGMVRYLVSEYATGERAVYRGALDAPEPVEYPEVGLYHPRAKDRIVTDLAALPMPEAPAGRIGVLLMRAYVLSGDTAHYDAVIAALEARGFAVVPAFAAGLDGRPAMDAYFTDEGRPTVDTVVSLCGFSLVGGPAYNDCDAAQEALAALDVPYIAAHALEFQALDTWRENEQGLSPVEATMMVALPELDGAIGPIVYGGRAQGTGQAMQPETERVERLADRAAKLARLRRSEVGARKVAITLYGFPPNAGAVGTAAHLSVFESLYNVLHAMKAEGYDLTPPESVEALRWTVLQGNAEMLGQPANVAARVPAEDFVAREPHLAEIEAAWGPAPGKTQSNGREIFILGAHFGNVFVGVQPTFGYEGDPMRLLFERSFAPTHAFSAYYRWLREDFAADAVLHFGMHGALEFMPGKQVGLGADCWPDRLIGDLPNIYLYAANNPSEATLAKRRSAAITVTHLTPPLTEAGLYKGLSELKESIGDWRKGKRTGLAETIQAQAAALDLAPESPLWDAPEADIEALRLRLIDYEQTLIPHGLHIVGAPLAQEARTDYLNAMRGVEGAKDDEVDTAAGHLDRDSETPALLRALSGRFIRPVPGGDILRNPAVLPTGRNIHAFDPFRMPTAFAMTEGAAQTAKLLERARIDGAEMPRSVAMVLWGSDNIKSDGGPIAQALALMGARPRFDGYGRLTGAALVPLAELGRARIDVVMTLSGIFRDLLPLQTKLLAEAAWLAATADEPLEMNHIRAHTLAHIEATGADFDTAALRVFSNAEGAYGANVNHLIDSGAWSDEAELAETFEARKGFAYGRDGKGAKQGALFSAMLGKVDVAYQNLESAELGVTTVDHYFDTLGGVGRAVRKARGADPAIYIGDQTRGDGKVRSLSEQVALETRTRSLNPKWYEALLNHGHEGVRQIEAQVTNTMGWSATTGQVDPWVYQRLSETFVLDDAMRQRLAELNPVASARVANRLIEATERDYWRPDPETLAALRDCADELEDRVEGIMPMAAE